MSLRAQRLTQFLVATSLVGCCIKPPSSVDSVPGDWINLIEKGLPTGLVPGKSPTDRPDEFPGLPKQAGNLPGQVDPAEPSQPTRLPEPVPVTDPPPVTVQVEERKPSPVPVTQPGITPSAVPGDDTAPGSVPLPTKPPAGLGIPLPAQPAPSANPPTTPAVPTLGIFGRDSLGSAKPAPALPLLDTATDAAKPSQGFSLLGDASESDRTTPDRSPSLGLSETPNTRDRGISPGLTVPATSSAESRQGLIRLTPDAELGSDDGTPRAPSLGLLGSNASSGAPKRVPLLADSAQPKAQVDSVSAVPQLSIPAQRPGVGADGSAPLPSPEIQSPATAPARSEGEASLRLPGLNTPAASVGKATSSNALGLSPSPAPVPVAGINPALPLPTAGPAASAPKAPTDSKSAAGTVLPLTVNESLKATSVVPVTRSGSALTPPAVAEVPADSPVDSVILDKSSRALKDADAARRRLDVLRQEMRGYEFEAEQLRALLRRVLGLDEPTSSPVIEPDSRAPVRLNDDGE
jgi:hypothetical protein